MLLPYDKVQMKHMTIPQHTSKQLFDYVFTGSLPDLVIVVLVSEADFTGGNQRNPFNFQTLNLCDIRINHNSQEVSRSGYTPNYANGIYMQKYITIQEQLGYDIGDKCVALTPDEWANGYTIYAFKITDGPIEYSLAGPRSSAIAGNISLELAFNPATNKNIKVILLYQMCAVFKIDRYSNCVPL